MASLDWVADGILERVHLLLGLAHTLERDIQRASLLAFWIFKDIWLGLVQCGCHVGLGDLSLSLLGLGGLRGSQIQVL